MTRKQLALVPLCAALVFVLGVPLLATARNTLGGKPPTGVRHGVASHAGSTLVVKLEKSTRSFSRDLNNSLVTITEVAPGTGAAPIYDATEAGIPFDVTFPNGAYLITDAAQLHRIFAFRSQCRQLKADGSASWDPEKVYCDKTGITKIKVVPGPGDDRVIIDPSVTVPVTVKCSGKQTKCGHSCFQTDAYSCCDPIDVCWAGPGYSCAEVCL